MLSGNILVIEDDSKMRKAITTIMKKEGHEVTAAADGETALKQAQETEFDLAIVDLKLPGIDGIEVSVDEGVVGEPVGAAVGVGSRSCQHNLRAPFILRVTLVSPFAK